MAYCIKYSEFDLLKHKPVSGPWKGGCLECAFPSSSSSLSSGFYACARAKMGEEGFSTCLEYELIDQQAYDIVLGPFYGSDDCYRCGSSSTSYPTSSSSSSSSSSSFTASSSSSSTVEPPPTGCECIKEIYECACWDIPFTTPDGIKPLGIPKFVRLAAISETGCLVNAKLESSIDCFALSGAGFASNALRVVMDPKDCFDGLQEKLSQKGCASFVGTESAEFTFSPSTLQVWDSDGCDKDGNPINPIFLTHNIMVTISNCGSKTFGSQVQFTNLGMNMSTGTFNMSTGTFTNSWSYDSCFAGYTYNSMSGVSIPWSPRYRREYNDWTIKENNTGILSMYNSTSSPGLPAPVLKSYITMNSEPTCRKPEESRFCGCLDANLYNVIELESLEKTTIPVEWECNGNPIDINAVCGAPYSDPGGDLNIPGGVTMYLSPFSGSVPVIDKVAYDTTSIPASTNGKINVVKIHFSSTRNGIRYWTCDHLKFATVRNDWKTNPIAIIADSIGSQFTSEEQNVNFNWPFNDLYFSNGCPGGDTVNLVPC